MSLQPSDRFRAWVREFGYTRLARELGVLRGTVHSWTHPTRPALLKPALARKLLTLSVASPGTGGPLDWPDVYGPATPQCTLVQDFQPAPTPLQLRARAEAHLFLKLVQRGVVDVRRALADLSADGIEKSGLTGKRIAAVRALREHCVQELGLEHSPPISFFGDQTAENRKEERQPMNE